MLRPDRIRLLMPVATVSQIYENCLHPLTWSSFGATFKRTC